MRGKNYSCDDVRVGEAKSRCRLVACGAETDSIAVGFQHRKGREREREDLAFAVVDDLLGGNGESALIRRLPVVSDRHETSAISCRLVGEAMAKWHAHTLSACSVLAVFDFGHQRRSRVVHRGFVFFEHERRACPDERAPIGEA